MSKRLLPEFAVKPAVAAPNVRTNGGRDVHAGCFARPCYTGVRFGQYKVAALCHEDTPQCWTFTATSDPVTCTRCLKRLRAAGLKREGVTQPVEVSRVRLELALELENRGLIPYSVPMRLRLSPSSQPRPGWLRDVRKVHDDLLGFVAAAAPADATDVSGLIGLGVAELAALFAELDDCGHLAAA